MPRIIIRNVGVFEGDTIETRPTFSLEVSAAGPGHLAETVIDGTGCTLMPGLIDAKIDADCAPWAFHKFAAAGVTTVIDGSSGTKDTQTMHHAASQSPGWPSYFASGSAGGAPGWGALTMFPYRNVEVLASPSDAERFVLSRVQRPERSDFVKAIIDLPGLDDQSLQALVDTAHQHGKLVIAHASRVSSYRRALQAGCDILTPVPLDGALEPEVLNRLGQRKVAVIPTLTFLRRALQQTRSPPSAYAAAMAAVRDLNAAGVPICAGTAANEVEGLDIPFGEGLYHEMVLLTEAGLSNADALRAATSTPAQAFKLPDRGKLVIGTRSDAILLQGNPLQDISAVRQVLRVWIDGIEVDRVNGLRTPGVAIWSTAFRYALPGTLDGVP